jgi:hypothetical protein
MSTEGGDFGHEKELLPFSDPKSSVGVVGTKSDLKTFQFYIADFVTKPIKDLLNPKGGGDGRDSIVTNLLQDFYLYSKSCLLGLTENGMCLFSKNSHGSFT